jgi:hypothetical protein
MTKVVSEYGIAAGLLAKDSIDIPVYSRGRYHIGPEFMKQLMLRSFVTAHTGISGASNVKR